MQKLLTPAKPKLAKNKFCCDGLNAELVTPIKSITKNGVYWRRGIYKCSKCGEFSLRSESQLQSWNTMVELISKEKALHMLEDKKKFIEEMRYKNGMV